MKMSEAEPAIRSLATIWFATLPTKQQEHPSFSDFKVWLAADGRSDLLSFRSVMGADYDAEAWFDKELTQAWRRNHSLITTLSRAVG